MATIPFEDPQTPDEFSRAWTWGDGSERPVSGGAVEPQTDAEWLDYWHRFYTCDPCGEHLPGYGDRVYNGRRRRESCPVCDDRARAQYVAEQEKAARWLGQRPSAPAAPPELLTVDDLDIRRMGSVVLGLYEEDKRRRPSDILPTGALGRLPGWNRKMLERRVGVWLQRRGHPTGRGQWQRFVGLVIGEPDRFRER